MPLSSEGQNSTNFCWCLGFSLFCYQVMGAHRCCCLRSTERHLSCCYWCRYFIFYLLCCRLPKWCYKTWAVIHAPTFQPIYIIACGSCLPLYRPSPLYHPAHWVPSKIIFLILAIQTAVHYSYTSQLNFDAPAFFRLRPAPDSSFESCRCSLRWLFSRFRCVVDPRFRAVRFDFRPAAIFRLKPASYLVLLFALQRYYRLWLFADNTIALGC